MRSLLDECIDERLRHLFTEYDCQTARYAGFAGLTKGLYCWLENRRLSMWS
jgi:hypothetical protein